MNSARRSVARLIERRRCCGRGRDAERSSRGQNSPTESSRIVRKVSPTEQRKSIRSRGIISHAYRSYARARYCAFPRVIARRLARAAAVVHDAGRVGRDSEGERLSGEMWRRNKGPDYPKFRGDFLPPHSEREVTARYLWPRI